MLKIQQKSQKNVLKTFFSIVKMSRKRKIRVKFFFAQKINNFRLRNVLRREWKSEFECSSMSKCLARYMSRVIWCSQISANGKLATSCRQNFRCVMQFQFHISGNWLRVCGERWLSLKAQHTFGRSQLMEFNSTWKFSSRSLFNNDGKINCRRKKLLNVIFVMMRPWYLKTHRGIIIYC